jgi:hypothetical protein
MKVMGTFCGSLIISCVLVVVAGCGSGGLSFYNVSGEMTLDGKPIEYAEMHINPTSEGDSGRTVAGRVINGQIKLPIGVASGPAEWTIAVVETKGLNIKDYENISDSEDSKILQADKQVFVEQIPIDKEHYLVELTTPEE